MDIFIYSEVSRYFPDSPCSGAHCNPAGSEKLQSGCLVALCALQLLTYIEKPAACARMCCGELRCDAIRSEAAVGKGNTSRSVNHVHQRLHGMTDRGCSVLLTFIRVSLRPNISFLLLFSSYRLTK